MHLLKIIDYWAKAAPSRLVHISDDRTMTWGELAHRSDMLALALRRLGDDRRPVVVIGSKETDLLVGFIASTKSGRPYVPVDISWPKARVENILSACDAAIALTAEQIHEMTDGDGAAARESYVGMADSAEIGADDPYYILFTSGSTGTPKGVVITRQCLDSFLQWQLDEQGLHEGKEEVFLNQAPFSFDVSVMDTYCALATGGTLFSVTRNHLSDPRRLYQALRGSGVTFWVSTPSFARFCLAEKTFAREMLPALHTFWFCGETLPPELVRTLLDRFPGTRIWNTYGPTETTVATTSVLIDREMLERYPTLPVGRAMPGTAVICAGEDGSESPDGERGEIVIAGPNVGPGYLGRPDLTAKAFFKRGTSRAFRTGDWGTRREGLIFCEGRMDRQIKLNGYRIELGDVEANLRALDDIRDAVVLPSMRDGKVDSLAAFVVLSRVEQSGSAVEDFAIATAIKRKLALRVPAYMIPRQIICVGSLPTTANGKTDRQKLATLLT